MLSLQPLPEPLLLQAQILERFGWTKAELWQRVKAGDVEAFRIAGGLRFRTDPSTWSNQSPASDQTNVVPLRSYAARREYLRDYQREWVARRRAEYFEGKCCIDCGSTEKLEIDHRDPALKIAHNVWSWREERRLAELAKCDVRCQVCHRKRHRAPHGSERRYRQGCRCDVCLEKWAQVNALRRARNAAKREGRLFPA